MFALIKSVLSSLNSLVLNLILALIKLWKRILSPLFGDRCRFYPTCSEYSYQAYQKYGLLRGSFLSIKRILRCHPYCKGGDDPLK